METIFLNEGPHHGTEIQKQNLSPGQHFEHNGCVYRTINSTFAQFCRKSPVVASVSKVQEVKAPKAKAPKKSKAKKA